MSHESLFLGIAMRTLAVEDESKETLTSALQFFVEAGTYLSMTHFQPNESDLVTKSFHGESLLGETCICIS